MTDSSLYHCPKCGSSDIFASVRCDPNSGNVRNFGELFDFACQDCGEGCEGGNDNFLEPGTPFKPEEKTD